MMAADYRHIGGVENRLGRHYSRFLPFWPAASFADQSLALRKSWNAGSNRRSQARASRFIPAFPAGVRWWGLVRSGLSPPRQSASQEAPQNRGLARATAPPLP